MYDFLVTGRNEILTKNKENGYLKFYFPLDSDKGLGHLLEHILGNFDIENREKDMKDGVFISFKSEYDNSKVRKFAHAQTNLFDKIHNIGSINFSFNKEIFKDPAFFRKYCEEFLGNPIFKRDGEKLYKREVKNEYFKNKCGRAPIEMYGKYNMDDVTRKNESKKVCMWRNI